MEEQRAKIWSIRAYYLVRDRPNQEEKRQYTPASGIDAGRYWREEAGESIQTP